MTGGDHTLKVAPIKPSIKSDVLDRIDVRVGTIRQVDDVAGSNKLVKPTVSFGDRTRSILAGKKQRIWGSASNGQAPVVDPGARIEIHPGFMDDDGKRSGSSSPNARRGGGGVMGAVRD